VLPAVGDRGHGYTQPSVRTTYEGKRCTLTVASPAPGIFHTIGSGVVDTEMAGRIVEAGDRVVADTRPIVAFHDWEALTGYEPKCREILTDWGLRIRADVEAVHLLVRSRLVAMGVSVAGLVLQGMLVSYSTRAPFEAALEERVKRARAAQMRARPEGAR